MRIIYSSFSGLLHLSSIISLQHFAHGTTAQLPCHVQIFIAITLPQPGWEHDELSVEFELRWKNHPLNWPRFTIARQTNANGYSTLVSHIRDTWMSVAAHSDAYICENGFHVWLNVEQCQCISYHCYALYMDTSGICGLVARWLEMVGTSRDPTIYSSAFSHYNDVIMSTMASQIASLTIVYPTVYSGPDQRKHQSSASLAFVRGIHRGRWIPRTNGQ